MSKKSRFPTWLPIALAVVVMVVLLVMGWRFLSRRALATEIPSLPELGRSTPAVVRQLSEADAEAREHSGSGEALGQLAKAYHANSFYEQARIAYRLAMRVDPKEHRWPYYLGVLEVTTGENERAIAFLTRALELNSENPHAWARLGQLYFRREMRIEAERAFRQALKLDPTHPHACVGMGRLAGQRVEWAEATSLLEGAVRAHPNFGPAHRVLAMAYGHLGRTEDMERHEELGSDIGLQMKDPLMWEMISGSSTGSVLVIHAQIAQNWGELDWANRLLRSAVEVAPNDPDVRLAIGRFLAKAGAQYPRLLREARMHLEVGLELDATYVVMRHDYASALLALGDTTGAVAQWHRILREEPDHAMAMMSLGQVHFYRKEYARARDYYQRGVSIPPDTPFSLGDQAMGHHRYAIACERTGLVDEALRQFQLASEINPQLVDTYVDWARVLKARGDVEGGVGIYRKGISANPKNVRLRLGLGNYLLQANRYSEARSALREALSISPRDPRALAALGYVELRVGDPETAIMYLQQALTVKPDYALAHFHLGNALMEQGKRDEAIRHYEAALKIQPSFQPAQAALSRVRQP